MAKKISVLPGNWGNPSFFCEALEEGNIIFFEQSPFLFPEEEIDFLLSQKQSKARHRKNIAYKPQLGKITNHDTSDPIAAEKLQKILKNYSEKATAFIRTFLAPYSSHLRCDYASFRPFQEKGRALRTRARNDLLHIDAFPSRPVQGDRILRFFTNINRTESRNWITSKGFAELIEEFIDSCPIPSFDPSWLKAFKKGIRLLGFGMKESSPYDKFMLQFHHFLKENSDFQKTCPKDPWQFPPGSCWIVFTDQVSHAALSGQYALEQTFFVPQRSLLFPEKSPLAVLEKKAGRSLVCREPDHILLG